MKLEHSHANQCREVEADSGKAKMLSFELLALSGARTTMRKH